MSSLAAATLARAGVSEIVIANRTPDRAERLAQILNENEGGDTDVLARAVPMDSVPVELTRADIAISCTGATGLVLTAESVAAAVEGRTGGSVATAEPAAKPAVRRAGSARTASSAVVGDHAQLAPTSVGTDEDCPLDLSAVQGTAGFSVLGEAAVAGMAAAELEQHAAWVDKGDVAARARAGRPCSTRRPTPTPSPRSSWPSPPSAGCPSAAGPSRSPRPPARARARAAGPRHAP